MTVPVQTIYNSYIANGATTVFPYGFKITDAADLQVTVNGIVVTTGFTVSGVGVNGGGNVTFALSPLSTQKVLIELFPVAERLTDYAQFGDWIAPVVNNDFDRIWLAIQKIFHDLTLSIKAPTDTSPTNLPAPTANNVFGWDSTGTKIINYPVQVGTPLVDLAAPSGSSLVGFNKGGTVQDALNALVGLTNIAALKALAVPTFSCVYIVQGYASAGDGGGGIFFWNATDATADNGGTVIACTANGAAAGRFNKLF